MSTSTIYNYKGTCEGCGSLFSSNGKATRFCSRTCGGRHRQGAEKTKLIYKTCPKCKLSFETVEQARKYCSKNCGKHARKMFPPLPKGNTFHEHTCTFCSKTFTSKKPIQDFCSKLCFTTNRRYDEVPLVLIEEANLACQEQGSVFEYIYARGKYTRDGVRDALKKYNISLRVKPKRQNKILSGVAEKRYVQETGCAICSDMRHTERAHIVPRTQGGSGKLDNIVPLCPMHHKCYDRKTLDEKETILLNAFLSAKFTQDASPAISA